MDSRLRGNDKSRVGFMLLEVILSIIIIASGLVMVLRSYTTSARASQAAGTLSKECLFLEEKLFELDAKTFKEGIKEEESYGDIEGYRWHLSVMPMGDEKELSRLDLRLVRGKHIINISTYRKYKEG